MKLTLDSINNINLFENLTGARVKDCITEERKLIFLVEEGNIKQALGKENSNIFRLEKLLKKQIEIIGYSDDVLKFVRNLIYPNRADEIKIDNNNVIIVINDPVMKGRAFGRGRENLKKINDLVKKYFKMEVKIV
ncbi:NusA-like transcription termination signal-binding factor [Candidatus Woesearchaeota archaeon]|nr:MAG: N utilization substance protein A [archaeon GW2011_AR18]MBS3161230.1 NusA-like transcription termination signal-binding factor [Candidatus Woesearchaeota archaeon]HIH25214.1 NusA-like transcription termination signal-binding factor [Nanoarchaeota archaeon]